jgi:magnesium transporter
MNFDFMPELHSHYGYIGVWLVMLAVAGGLIFYFKRKKYF